MAQATLNSSPAAPDAGVVANEIRKKSFWRVFVERNKSGTFGFIVMAVILLLTFIGPFFVHGENRTDVTKIYAGPSWSHPLGFDHSGRDIWYQIVHGGRSVILVAVLAALIATFIGVVLGALAAMVGGKFDVAMQTISDIVLTVPSIILLAVLAAYVRLDGPVLLALILASTGWPGLLLAVRSQVLSLKEREYVEAARTLDLGLPRILFREVLPNMASYIIINFVFHIRSAVYGQVALYFLGLVSLAGVNWGIMINEAFRRGAVFNAASMMGLLAPVTMVVLLLWSLILIARSLEDVFNPRLREV
jgi:peptide/nickel transport system permease protein